MVLSNLSVPGRFTNLDNSRPLAYCAFSRCGGGWFGYFTLVYHFSFSFSLSLGYTVSKGRITKNNQPNKPECDA